MILLILTGKVIAFILFCILSAFVLLYGKNGTGIKSYYVLTMLVLLGVMIL